MTRFSTLMASATALIGAGLAIAPAPLAAQQGRLAEIIVYGTDPCPRSTDDAIVVCVRKGERERNETSRRCHGRTRPRARCRS